MGNMLILLAMLCQDFCSNSLNLALVLAMMANKQLEVN